MRKRVVVWLAVAVACAGPSVAAPPTPPADAHDGASEVAALDAPSLIEGSSDGGALSDLFEDEGFGGAVARTWTGASSGDIRLVEIRVHRFAAGDGAAAFLGWVGEHPEDLIGAADQVRSTDEELVFTHEPGGCCPKDTSSVLEAWTDGDLVWTVVVAGPSATVAVADGIRANVEVGGAP
jgi:hypothetical protein